MTDTSSLWLQIGFGLAALAMAALGAMMANDASKYAALGEVPDDGGGAALGGLPDSPFEVEKRFYIDLRSHYRRSSSELARTANFVLLLSVVAGVFGGFTNNAVIASGLVVLWIVFALFVVRFIARRRGFIRESEIALNERRLAYNECSYRGMTSKMGDEYAKVTFRPIVEFEAIRW